MRKHAFLILLDLLAILALLAYGWTIRYARAGAADPTWTAVQARGELRVGTDPGFRPFAEEREGQWRGYDIDLAREIGKRLNLQISFKAVGYDALYDTLAAGEVDLLASALPFNPAQGWRARFSSAYLNAGQALVVQRSSGISNTADLQGHIAAAALGTEGDTILRSLQRANPALTIRTDFDTPEAALAALGRGEVDAVITDTISALGLTESDRRFSIAQALSFEPYVLAMPVNAYQLQAEVERILGQLRDEGFIERLNTKWFGSHNGRSQPTSAGVVHSPATLAPGRASVMDKSVSIKTTPKLLE